MEKLKQWYVNFIQVKPVPQNNSIDMKQLCRTNFRLYRALKKRQMEKIIK